MQDAFKARLRHEILISYHQILRRARRRVKGIRMEHFWAIEILGPYPDGLRLAEVKAMDEISRQNCWVRLGRAIEAGFVMKGGRGYMLNDAGREVYATLTEESNGRAEEMVNMVMNEVRSRLNG